jgi:aryl-alcohol dehydrogenase-like predicted oxidoreductase
VVFKPLRLLDFPRFRRLISAAGSALKSPMEKRTFGRTGLSVSVLGFGGAPAAYLKTDAAQAAGMLERLLDAGLNVIDTAAGYPGSEQFIGDHLSHRRGDYVLISKCGTKISGVDAPDFSYELVSRSVDRALKLLKTDVIDVMLLHSCDLETLKKGEALRALSEARQAGKIRFAGYSGDNEAVTYAAGLPEMAVVEMSINITDQVNIDQGLAAARKHNVGVIAKRPIANAAWKDLSTQQGLYASYAKAYTDRLAKMKLNPSDLGFTADPSKAWPEIALRFTLSQSGVSTAIVGTTNPANAEANVQAAAKGPLAPEVIQRIRDAFNRAQAGDHWPGLT